VARAGRARCPGQLDQREAEEVAARQQAEVAGALQVELLRQRRRERGRDGASQHGGEEVGEREGEEDAPLAVGVGVYLGSGTTAAPASTFVLLDGSQKNTADLKGKVTLVNFWATSCVTCVAEMPKVIATYDKYKSQGYDTLAVAMSYDPPSYVVNFAETRKLPFKVAIDNTGSVAQAWGDVKLTPTTYLVNKRGEIVKRYVGEPDFAELHKLIEKLLAEA
jgi:peroxiredoxin